MASSSESNHLSASAAAGTQEPRRRSVHFDTSPAATIGVSPGTSDVSSEASEAAGSETGGFCQQARRKSAPATNVMSKAAGIRGGDGSHEDVLGVVGPELRESLNKLHLTVLDNPEDLDMINPKLIARDELEILRLRQERKRSQDLSAAASSSSRSNNVNQSEAGGHPDDDGVVRSRDSKDSPPSSSSKTDSH